MNLPFSVAGNMMVCRVSFFAGCVLILSFTGQQSPSSHQKKEFFFTPRQPADTLFHMCDVLTGSEMEALSPFGKPFKKADPGILMDDYSQCHYDFESDDDNPQVMITLNDMHTAAAAKETYSMYVSDYRSMWEKDPEWIYGLCDSAYFGGSANPVLCDICGVVASSGQYFITVTFKGYVAKIPASQKKGSAINIIKLLFQKKPYLKRR